MPGDKDNKDPAQTTPEGAASAETQPAAEPPSGTAAPEQTSGPSAAAAQTAAAETAAAAETNKKKEEAEKKKKEGEEEKKKKKKTEGGDEEKEEEMNVEEAKEEEAKEEEEEKEEEEGPKMRAVVLTGFGGTRMVKVLQQAIPTAAEGQVLIRVQMCGMSFQDVKLRQGFTDHPPPRIPLIMGQECAGVVEALGPGASGFTVGDRVIAFTPYKAWAELVAVPETLVYRLPDSVSFQDGVCLLVHFVTAYFLLFHVAALREGQSLLLHSAAGGVGQAILQLSRQVEGVRIFATASPAKQDSLKDRVDHFLPHTVDYVQEIKKVAPDGLDVVLDCLCGDDTNRGISLLKPLGKYVMYGTSNQVSGETKSFFTFAKSWWQVDKVSPVKLYEENRTLGGFNLRQLLYRGAPSQHGLVRGVVDTLLTLHSQGKVVPVVDSVWAFEDVGDAMHKIQHRDNVGKLLLDPNKEPLVKETAESTTAEATEAAAGAEGGEGDKDKDKDGQTAGQGDGQSTADKDKDGETQGGKKTDGGENSEGGDKEKGKDGEKEKKEEKSDAPPAAADSQ